MNFNDLPQELILKIFSYLTFKQRFFDVRNVCEKWRYLSLLGVNRIIFVNKDVEDDYFNDLCVYDDGIEVNCWRDVYEYISMLNKLKCIYFYGCFFSDEQQLPLIATLLTDIEKIVFKSRRKILRVDDPELHVDTVASQLLRYTSSLKEVLFIFNRRVSNDVFEAIFERNKHLNSLTMDGTDLIGFKGFSLRKMRKLIISPNHTVDSFKEKQLEILKSLVTNSKQSLQVLSVGTVSCRKSMDIVLEFMNLKCLLIGLRANENWLSKWRFNKLEALHIAIEGYGNSSFDLIPILERNECLKHLSINDVCYINGDLLRNMFKVCPNLRSLSVEARRISEDLLSSISSESLTRLSLSGFFIPPLKLHEMVKNLPSLTVLQCQSSKTGSDLLELLKQRSLKEPLKTFFIDIQHFDYKPYPLNLPNNLKMVPIGVSRIYVNRLFDFNY